MHWRIFQTERRSGLDGLFSAVTSEHAQENRGPTHCDSLVNQCESVLMPQCSVEGMTLDSDLLVPVDAKRRNSFLYE